MVVLAGSGSGLVDVASGRVRALAGHDVRAIDGPWAVLDGREVAPWAGDGGPRAGASVPPEDMALTCVAALPDPARAALVGSEGAHVFLYRGDGAMQPVSSFDTAEGRPDWYTPWGGPPDVRSASSSPEGTLLVNVHVGGILRSTDEGTSWQPTIDIHTDVHQVLALGGGRAVAACAAGLATSEDDGVTWAIHDEGLHATYARAVAVAGETLLLSVSAGPGGQEAAIYRRPLSGGPFERCGGGLPSDLGGNVDTAWLVGAGDGTAAVATKNGTVFVSRDEGATWETGGPAVPDLRCLVLD
jgi:hypothetical protein